MRHLMTPSLALAVTSGRTATRPSAWHVEVVTSIDDQEMHNPLQNYWEGVVAITGTRGREPIDGVGFVELTGYATDPFDP